MPDQHKYYKKKYFASYEMFREGIQILLLSFNYFKLPISDNHDCGLVCVDLGFE